MYKKAVSTEAMKMFLQCLTPQKQKVQALKPSRITLDQAEPSLCTVLIFVQGRLIVSVITALMVVIIQGSCLLYFPQRHGKD